MANRIAVRLQDGQIITYQTYFQEDREIAAEIKRLFPFATLVNDSERLAFLPKPYTATALIKQISQMLFL